MSEYDSLIAHLECGPIDLSVADKACVALCKVIAERDKARSRFNDIDLCQNAQAPCDWSLKLIARAETAERERDELRARLATYERWNGDLDTAAEKLAKEVGAREPFSTQVAVIALTAARAAGAAEERERCAKIAEPATGCRCSRCGLRRHIAAAIRAEQAPTK